MDSLQQSADFTAEELAYLNSQGQTEPPAAEPEARAPEPEAEPASDAAPEHQPPEAEAAAEPEADDPEVIEADDETHKGRKVQYNAYLRQKKAADAAREEREQLRQKLEATQREQAVQNARIEERFKLWQQGQQRLAAEQARAQQQPEAPPPDRNQDPLGYMEWQDQRLSRLEQATVHAHRTQQQAAQIAQLDNAYRADSYQAAKEVPEYTDAYNYMVARAERAIAIQNPGWNQQQIRAAVEHQERALAAQAFQRRQRPAAMIIEMAHTYGWVPPSQRAPQAAAPAQPDVDAQQARLDAVSRGQEQNRTLSAAGRPGGNTATMTLERFLDLPDDQARDWAEKNPGAMERLGGGR